MKKQILLALFFSFTYLGLNAQCNVPFPPSLTCASAPVICSLDGYCTTSGPFNSTDQPNTFCGSVQNNQWFSFVAGSTNITLDFIVGLCGGTTSGTGLQAQVYTMCGAPWTAASNCLYEISPGSTETLTMTGLTVGNVYYLMTDGFSGDICDYTIEVTSGSTTPPTPDPAGAIIGDAQFCPGASSVTYCATPTFGAAFYDWTIPLGATIVGADNGECITIDFSGITGTTGVITATPTNGCESGAPSSFNVSEGPAPTTPDVDFILCPGDSETYGNTVYSTAGTFLNDDIANAQGCLIETFVNVTVGQDVMNGLTEVICGGEVSTTGETSSGNYTYNLFTSLGCDSTVTLDLTVLNPQTGIFPVTDEIDCSGGPVQVGAVVTDTDPTISYIWSGPNFIQNFPTDPNISVFEGGVYTVFAEQTFGGVTCVSPSFSVTVNENTTPPTADPGLGGVIDCGGAAFTLGGQGSSNTSTYSYSWTGPNGYSMATQFPTTSEPGTYCFFMIDNATSCISSTECVTVTGDNTPPVAMATASNDLDCGTTTATLDPAGSDPGTYTWAGPGSPNGSNPTVNLPGTYTLTVSSGNGCTSTQEVIITQDNSAPTASITPPTAIDCNNSTVSLDGSGSSSGVNYLWSTGDMTSTVNVGAGTYTLTVTNTSNGCTDETSVVVNDNSTVVTAEVDVQGQITCNNGSVTLSAINVTGSSNPTYSWSNGMSGQTITVNTDGSVTVTVTDATTGCTGDATGTVTSDNNDPMAVAGVSGELNCDNTSVVLSTAGSTTGGNITASWSAADPNNVTTPGVYTLTITNTTNGCEATADVTVIQDATAPVAAIAVPIAIDCNNLSTTLDGNSSTGTNLSYAWTGQGTGAGPTLNATAAGTYTLTVTNMDNGCTDTEEITVVDNTTTVTVTATVSNELTCTQSSATLDISGGSGSSSPTYTWTGPETGSGSTLSVSTPGTYTVTLIDSNTGCEGSTTVTVLQDASGPTSLVVPANDLTCTVSSVTLDGTASTTGNSISYQWFVTNGGVTTAVPSGTTAIIDVTNAGDYTLVVTDADNGCETTSSVVPVILDSAAPTASAVAGNNGLLSCSLSSLTIDGSSSTGNCLTYEWTNNGSIAGTDPTLDVSNAGDYILVVTNCDNGCTDQILVNVAADAGLPNAAVEPVVNLDCNNSSSTLQGSGSSNTGGTVSVEWFFGGASVGVDPDFTTMQEGEYTFVVTDDGNGCSSSAIVQLSENTDQPMIDVAAVPIIDCNNQMVTVNASSSASGTNIAYQWQDALGNDLPLETSNTLTTGIAGDYIFEITNMDNGCISTEMINVPENIEAPVFDATALNNIDCNNIEAQLTSTITSSFSTDLSYSWTLSGTTISTMSSLSTANPGDITVIVTDIQNGCTSQMDVTVLDTTLDPSVVASASDNGALNCVTIETILDGTGTDTGANFTYSWTLDTDPTNTLSTDLMYTTEDPGIYVLTTTNTDNGCVSSIPVAVTQSIAPPTSVAGVSNNTLTCTDPEATLDGSGSSIGANFSYQWYDVTTLPGSPTVDQLSYNVGVAGTYELVVTNTDNGCTAVSDQVVIGQSSDVPTAVISNDGILTCANGDVLLDGFSSTAGGTLIYEWIDANGTVTTGPELTVTTIGQVTLNITDTNNGCTSTDQFLVEDDIDAPTALTSTGGTLLCGQPSFLLDGSASSQNGNFTYAWWTFENGAPVITVEDGLTYEAGAPGDYVIIVTNTDNGCTEISAPVTVGEDSSAPSLSMVPSAPGLNCDIQTITFDASGSVVSTGSAGTLIYEWIDATSGASLGNTATIDVSTTDAVLLTITDDANNCFVSQSYSTTQDIEEPSANAGPIQTLFCGTDDVTLDGSNSSANGDPITFAWYAPNDPINVMATTETVDASIAGTWTLLITNTDNGCSSTSTVEVDQDVSVPTAVVDFSGMLTCADTELTVDGSNSTIQSQNGTIEYLWENGSTTETATFDAPGTYTLLITDNGNGCSAEQSFTIEQDILEPVADIQALTSSTISCAEPNLVFNGSASNNNGNPNGGTLTYEWTLDGNPVTGGTSDQVEISEPGELIVSVTNINNGCTATYLVDVDVSDDVPNVDIATEPQLSCIVDESTIVAIDNSINTADNTYLWTGPGTIVGETTLTPTVSMTGTYTLNIVNTVSGCDISITSLIEGDFDAPNALANATDQFDCITDEVTLDGNGSTTGSTISYSWITTTGVFTSGQNTFNPVVSAPGDYTLVVTDNGNGCSSIDVVTVSANTDVPTIAGVQVIDPNCFGENNGSITLDDVTGGQLPYLYSIDGGAFAPINQFSFLSAGEYDLVVEDANGCSTSQSVTITDPQELLVELGDDQPIGLGDEFQLSAQIIGAYDTIIWSANCPDSTCADQPEFTITPLNTVSYTVTVIDGNGCITTDQITLNVEKGREVFIPNVFTPNGNGPNDYFMVYAGSEVAKVHEFRVFNRWGEQVFGRQDYDPKLENTEDGWDGTLNNKRMNPAVFVYYVDIEYIDGRREVLKGDVALRR